MSAGVSGFSIQWIRLVKLRFDAPDVFVEEGERRYHVKDASVRSSSASEEGTCTVRIGVELVAKIAGKVCFSMKAEVEGLFARYGKGVPNGEMATFCAVHAPALLFPYLREVVTNVSARSGHPAILMPAVDWRELVQLYESSGSDK